LGLHLGLGGAFTSGHGLLALGHLHLLLGLLLTLLL
jgi:hypothetical protein